MTHMHQYGGDCSSSSSLSSRNNGTDDDRMIAVVLSEEYAKLDGAVAKRLSSLPSIPVRCSFLFLEAFLFFICFCIWIIEADD